MGIVIILLMLLSIELFLRLYEYAKQASPYDLSEYPLYKFYKKNTFGRHSYFTNYTIGVKNTPKVRSYSEGIRGNIKKRGKKMILCLGCSLTEGGALRESETYPGYLQKILDSTKWDVINAGIGGYGIFQIARFLKQLIKYKPKIVILQLLDLKRVPLNSKKLNETKKYFIFREKLKKFSMLLFYLLKLKKPKISYITSGYYQHHLNYPSSVWQKLNQKYLDEIKDTCKKNKIKLLVFHWLDNEFVKEYCTKNKIYSCDLPDYTKYYERNELHVHKRDSHPSPLWNRLVAKSVFNCLKTNRLVS